MTVAIFNPERIEIIQPRVARNELPWVKTGRNYNPERVEYQQLTKRIQPQRTQRSQIKINISPSPCVLCNLNPEKIAIIQPKVWPDSEKAGSEV
jgi:hypothetical protein